MVSRLPPYNDHSPVPVPKDPEDSADSDQALPRSEPVDSEDEPMLYCPVCSQRLNARKCKLFCAQCGYYMSCADYI
jgi:hypothetical protein